MLAGPATIQRYGDEAKCRLQRAVADEFGCRYLFVQLRVHIMHVPDYSKLAFSRRIFRASLDFMYLVGYISNMYEVRLTLEFQGWLDRLPDPRAQVRIAARLRQAGAGNLGDWKPISGGLSEMGVDVGAGYRLYFTRQGRILIVMLAGGETSTQRRDIRRAQEILKEIGDRT